jgi:hypothetical protein
MYGKQRDDETCDDVWQRIKRNPNGLCCATSARCEVDEVYLAGALKGSLNTYHVHWMITLDTSIVTLDELEEKVLTVGQRVDQVYLKSLPHLCMHPCLTTLKAN